MDNGADDEGSSRCARSSSRSCSRACKKKDAESLLASLLSSDDIFEEEAEKTAERRDARSGGRGGRRRKSHADILFGSSVESPTDRNVQAMTSAADDFECFESSSSSSEKSGYDAFRRRIASEKARGLKREINLFATVYIAAELEDRLLFGVKNTDDADEDDANDTFGIRSRRSAAGSVLVSAVNILNSRIGVSTTTDSPSSARRQRKHMLRNSFRFATASSPSASSPSSPLDERLDQKRRSVIHPGFRDVGSVVRLVTDEARDRGLEWKNEAEERYRERSEQMRRRMSLEKENGKVKKKKKCRRTSATSFLAVGEYRYRGGDALILCEGVRMFVEYLQLVVPHNKAWVDAPKRALDRLTSDFERYISEMIEPTLMCRSARLCWAADRQFLQGDRLSLLRKIKPEDLDIPLDLCPNMTIVGLAAQELIRLVLVSSPTDKLRSVARSYQIVSDSISLATRRHNASRRFGADEVFPVFILVVAQAMVTLADRAEVAHGGSAEALVKCNQIINSSLEQRAPLCRKYRHSLRAQIDYIESACCGDSLASGSEAGYCLANLRSAVAFVSGDDIAARIRDRLEREETAGD